MKIFFVLAVFLLSVPALASSDEDYRLKQLCRKNAEAYFAKETEKYGNMIRTLSFNHYNKNLNVCFAMIDEFYFNDPAETIQIGSGFKLYDVDEGTLYGSYKQMFSNNDTVIEKERIYTESPICESAFASSPSTLKSVCKPKEFRDYLKRIMWRGNP